jgi:D-alanine-D-alanine ligase
MSGMIDPKSLGKVAVLFGGSSAEREVSLNSGSRVLAALQRQGVDAHAFDPAATQLTAIEHAGFDRAFIALHGGIGENGTLQGFLEMIGLPYTGSGVLASALAMDKWRSKLVWQAAGLPAPGYRLIDAETDAQAVIDALGLPMFVKPVHEGSSVGVTKVKTLADLMPAWKDASQHDSAVIAETALLGGEFTVAVWQTADGLQALPPVRIVPATEFYDYEAKYNRDDTQYNVPCGLPEAQVQHMQDLAVEAFEALGCRGWGRIDFLLDSAGAPYVLEANTAPGMTDHSLVPMAARAAGVDYDHLVLTVAAMASLDANPAGA